jgi:hypothetical protein
MTHEIQIGDYVLFLENRPVPDVQSVGSVGQVVDPGHKPPDASKVYVRFPTAENFGSIAEVWCTRRNRTDRKA